MSLRAAVLLLLTVGACLGVATPVSAAGPASKPPPDLEVWAGQGHHRFVTVVSRDGAPALRLTALTKRRYARKWIEWKCSAVAGTAVVGGVETSGGGGEPVTANADLLDVERDGDYCTLQIVLRTVRHVRVSRHREVEKRTERLRQVVPITDEGRAFVASVRAAATLQLGVFVVGVSYDGLRRPYPSAATLVARTPLLALDRPDSPVVLGRGGLWTDPHRFRVVVPLADGTELFYERDAATRVVTSNALEALTALNSPDGWWNDAGSISNEPEN